MKISRVSPLHCLHVHETRSELTGITASMEAKRARNVHFSYVGSIPTFLTMQKTGFHPPETLPFSGDRRYSIFRLTERDGSDGAQGKALTGVKWPSWTGEKNSEDVGGERSADGRCDLQWTRVQVISEKLQSAENPFTRPLLRRSGLFVFVNIASSRSLSRSHREPARTAR